MGGVPTGAVWATPPLAGVCGCAAVLFVSAHPLEASVLRLFYALNQSGQINLRRLDGWYDIPRAVKQQRKIAA